MGLDQYVIGQDACQAWCWPSRSTTTTSASCAAIRTTDVELQKTNVLLHRPHRQSARPCCAQTLAKMLGVPFAIADATTLTEAGYVGEDVENILLKLHPGSGL